MNKKIFEDSGVIIIIRNWLTVYDKINYGKN